MKWFLVTLFYVTFRFQDIRSYFMGGGAKKPAVSSKPTQKDSPFKRKSVIALSSDEDDVVEATPDSKNHRSKEKNRTDKHNVKKRRIVDSDEEEEAKKSQAKIKESEKKEIKPTPKLKEVDISQVFGNNPVKRIERVVHKKPKREQDLFGSDDDADLSMVDISAVNATKSPEKPAKDKKKENKTPEKAEEKVKTPKKEKKESPAPKENKVRDKSQEKHSASASVKKTVQESSSKESSAKKKKPKQEEDYDDDDDIKPNKIGRQSLKVIIS